MCHCKARGLHPLVARGPASLSVALWLGLGLELKLEKIMKDTLSYFNANIPFRSLYIDLFTRCSRLI